VGGAALVTTNGDAFAELVAAEQLGVVVPAGDPAALATALQQVLYDDFAAGCRDRIAAVAQHYTWETVLAPLAEFCRHPRPAPDRLRGTPLIAPIGPG
jgi:glycosyltransferase involved in cell wall biosynthesis